MLKWGFWHQVILVWVVFFLSHYFEGIGTMLCAGAGLGIFLALNYVTRRSDSFAQAFWSTAALHAANNSVFFILLLWVRHRAG